MTDRSFCNPEGGGVTEDRTLLFSFLFFSAPKKKKGTIDGCMSEEVKEPRTAVLVLVLARLGAAWRF